MIRNARAANDCETPTTRARDYIIIYVARPLWERDAYMNHTVVGSAKRETQMADARFSPGALSCFIINIFDSVNAILLNN